MKENPKEEMTQKEISSSEIVPGIFLAEYDIGNMTMERIVVANHAILEILKYTKLPKEEQEKAVLDLVDRTPNWLEMKEEEQVEKIKSVLTMETVLYHLQSTETVRPQVDFCELGVDEEGSVVVYAYYTNLNREQRRAQNKKVKDAEKENIKSIVNALGGDNIIDLAKKKMEKMKQEGKLKVDTPKE